MFVPLRRWIQRVGSALFQHALKSALYRSAHRPLHCEHRRSSMRWDRAAAVALAAAYASAAWAVRAGPPEFGSAITVVTVPVFVTDRQGRAVTGLAAGDFAVTDDGRPVKLVGLREIDAAELLPEQTRDSP